MYLHLLMKLSVGGLVGDVPPTVSTGSIFEKSVINTMFI